MAEDLDVVVQPGFVWSSSPDTMSCLNAHPDLVPKTSVIDLVAVVVLEAFEIENSDSGMVDVEISAIHRLEARTAVILFEPVVKINLV